MKSMFEYVHIAMLGLNLFSPAEIRQMDMSDWVFDLLYDNRLERSDWFWWLGYYPARLWERVILSLPTSCWNSEPSDFRND